MDRDNGEMVRFGFNPTGVVCLVFLTRKLYFNFNTIGTDEEFMLP